METKLRQLGIGKKRHRSSKELEAKGVGNLGYASGKKHQGNGFGTILLKEILLKELLERCRAFGYNEIKLFPDINYLTC